MRNQKCDDDRNEEDISSLELKFCKAVTDNCADEGLEQAAQNRDTSRVEECLPILVFFDDEHPLVKRRILGNELDRLIGEVSQCS